ncbi:Protease production enhancer protein [Actinokineospora sp. UTMC 2448]|nr:Protease production enhancer protein [Actinokineospora sp. UTMC 2448]
MAQPPITLHLFDSRAAVVAVRGSTRGFAVREPVLVHALEALFAVTWTHGQPLLPQSGSRQTQLPDRDDIALLQLLGEGAKDEQVARALGMSVRTVRRRISLLLTTLDATSRFQAGVLARGRGWV